MISNLILSPARLGSLISAYLHYAETHLYSLISELALHIPKFVLQLEEDYKADPLLCITNLLHLKAWFIRYLSTGLIDKGSLPEGLWDKVLNLPKLIGSIVSIIHSLHNLEHKALVAGWLLNVITLAELSIESITAKTVAMLSNPVANNDTDASAQFASGLSAMGISPMLLLSQLKEFASSVWGYLIRGIGPNGVLGWTAVNDARSLLNSTVLGCFTSLAIAIGADKLVSRVELSAALPLISNFKQVPNLFSLILTSTIGAGVQGVVAVNYWLLVLLKPFHSVIIEIFSQLADFVTDNSTELLDHIRASTKIGSKNVLCFNVINDSAIPLNLISSFIDTLFGIKIGHLVIGIFSPASIGNTESGTVVETPNLILRGVLGIRFIIVLMFVTLVYSCISAAGMTGRGLFYFNANGDFVILDSRLASDFQKLVSRLGISITFFDHHEEEDRPSLIAFGYNWFWAGLNITGISTFLLNSMLSMNSLAWRVQVAGQASGFFFDAALFWRWIGPFLNLVDLKHLILMNTLPSLITGIMKPLLHSSFEAASGGAWYQACGLTSADVIQLYLYVLVVDCLTKLDSALRVSANYLQFAMMISARERIDRFIDLAGNSFPLSTLVGVLVDGAVHPFIWAFQSVVATAISTLFVMLQASSSVIVSSILATYEVILLLSSFNNSAVDYSWFMIHKNHINKLVKLLQLAGEKGELPSLTHTTKLPGYGHPFVVTFIPGQKTTIGTIGRTVSMPIYDNQASALSKLASYNPYV